MRILYAIQGTGNGHVSRAREILPLLDSYGKTDVLISGSKSEVDPGRAVDFRLKGYSFVYSSSGGMNLGSSLRTLAGSSLISEIRNLPVSGYDLIINDFEPVSAWAGKLRGIPVMALSHQYAVSAPSSPRPRKRNLFAETLLRHYAPYNSGFGFHFKGFNERISGPVIRREIRELKPDDRGHILVYLPAYSLKNLVLFLRNFRSSRFVLFHPEAKSRRDIGNCLMFPIDQREFLEKLRTSKGVVCGAGFELPSEAIYLGKKLLAIPIRGQYEQECNAAALSQMGIACHRKLEHSTFSAWLREEAMAISLETASPELTLENLFAEFELQYGSGLKKARLSPGYFL